MRTKLLLLSFLLTCVFCISIMAHANIAQKEKIVVIPKLYSPQDTTITQTGDGEYDWGVNFTQIEDDLLSTFIGIFWVGDGSGLLEIIFNLIPIIGNDPSADDFLFPIFLILFIGGPYYGLKKLGYID